MGKFIDLTGRTFGRLTVVSRNNPPRNHNQKPLWLCRCQCGKQVTVLGVFLRSGATSSCGCIRVRDLTGQTFGRLTVLRRVANRGAFTYWLCRCVCGEVREVNGFNLIYGSTRSCGCLGRDMLSQWRKRDLTGQTFGRLTVIGPAVDRPKVRGNYCWRCRCRCGSIVEVCGAHLTAGRTRSCGCLHAITARKRARHRRQAARPVKG